MTNEANQAGIYRAATQSFDFADPPAALESLMDLAQRLLQAARAFERRAHWRARAYIDVGR
jgi:hypothetical protein